MFGKKEVKTEEVPLPSTTRIDTIPTAFYGGVDPLVYHLKETSSPAPVLVPKPVIPVAPPPASKPHPLPVSRPVVHPNKATLLQPPSLQKKKPILSWIIAGTFVVSIVTAGGYYFFFSKNPGEKTIPVVVIPAPIPSLPPIVVPTVIPSSTPALVTSTPVVESSPRGGGSLVLPKVMFFRSPDNDSDTLTNAEEEVFMTDPELGDTDKDGYNDALEVQNLYNPKGIAPQKIIDSGIAKEYINPLWQYRMYYPSTWRVDPVNMKYDDVLLSGISGDYIEIRAFKKDAGQSFQDWFAQNLKGEMYTGFASLTNRFKVEGFKRTDMQVGFFVADTAVYSVVYFYGEEGKNLFPHVMEMVLQSFRPGKTPVEVPDQVVLPGVVSSSISSSTPVVTSTVISSSTPLSSTSSSTGSGISTSTTSSVL